MKLRFSAEERSKRDPMTFIPFGEGPRNCIAMRFAQRQIKVAVCHVLNQFRVFRVFETAVSPNSYWKIIISPFRTRL